MPNEAEKLAEEIERVKPIAEWLAIDHDKTRLEWNEYIKDAGEFLEYLSLLGYKKHGRNIICVIVKWFKNNPDPYILAENNLNKLIAKIKGFKHG